MILTRPLRPLLCRVLAGRSHPPSECALPRFVSRYRAVCGLPPAIDHGVVGVDGWTRGQI
ncbi:hypothetical protein GCM10009743_04240 [Kribbella swartbergensis]